MGRNGKAVRAGRISACALMLTVLLAAWDGTAQPSVEWSAYLGGTEKDIGYGIAVDSSGNVYTTGATASSGWVSDGWNTTYIEGGLGVYGDGYVVKLDTAGTHVWSTYLGGDNDEWGYGIAVDSSGNVYATGVTWSDGWVSDGWDTMFGDNHDGIMDGYVVKLNTDGMHQWSTYLGGTLIDEGGGIAVDSSGDVYATGTTSSTGWVSGGGDTILDGFYDGYVVKLDTDDGDHVWSTYMGGVGNDYAWGVAVDSSGNAYATGYSGIDSSNWVSGGDDTSYGGGLYDGYVVKLDTAGMHVWSTYLGGAGAEYGQGIAVDSSGNAYATGVTYSSDWGVGGGWDDVLSGATDGYVVKLSAAAGAHLWSTYLGGDDNERGLGIAVDSSGDVYATGLTGSTPTAWVSEGWGTTHNGGINDAYVVKLNTAGTHLWSSYLGGTGNDRGYAIAVDSSGGVYATGSTTTTSGWISGGGDTSYGGGLYDGYVVKLNVFQITLNPMGNQLYVDSPYTPTVATAYGKEPLSYQWTKNGTDITDATNSALDLASVTLSDAGTYACRVTDALSDTLTSTDAVLQVAEHIAITTHPVSQTVPQHWFVVFTVGSSGGIGPISYQWQRDDGDITGATQTLYTFSPVLLGHEGSYTCLVTDEYNAETIPSNAAILTVDTETTVPVTGGLALATAALAMGLVGALRLRRRTK